MTPRPRTISDADVLAAAGRTVARLGPGRLTLADVAREAGLAPATLVQRFGSKRALLLALAQAAADDVNACFGRVRAAQRSSLAAVVAAATEMTRYLDSPEEIANSLAFLQMDMSDPDFHGIALENQRAMIAGYRRLLDEAVEAGELVPCDTARIARAVCAVSGGSLLTWAIVRDGSAERAVRADVMTLINPYCERKSKVKGQRSKVRAKGRGAKHPGPT